MKLFDKDHQFIQASTDTYPIQHIELRNGADRQASATTNTLFYAAVSTIALSVFALDIKLEPGVAAGIPYLFALWIAYKAPDARLLWSTALVCSVFTVVGALISPPNLELYIVLFNRAFSLAAIWGTALVCWQARKARKDLEERSEQIRQIMEASPTATLMTNPDGIIVMANAEALHLLGYSYDEFIGKPVEILVPEPMRSKHPELRMGFVSRPSARRMGAGRYLYAARKDGSQLAVEIGLTPIRHHGKTFVVSSIIDISRRKALEDELRTINNELEQRVWERTEKLRISNEALVRSNTDLQRFAYIASHDLKTPLRSISGFVQLLAKDYGDKLTPEAHDWIDRTVSNTQRMHTLINDLLAYSRLDSRARPFESVDLNRIVDEVKELYAADLDTTGGAITHDTLPVLQGDSSQLAQLFGNLVGNGLKYHNDVAPHVHITARREGADWVIMVRDNGIGIDSRYHESIFDIFNRLHTSQAYPGTGIGLAVCRRVVHRHGGRIWVESEPGKGSTFFFTLTGKEQD